MREVIFMASKYAYVCFKYILDKIQKFITFIVALKIFYKKFVADTIVLHNENQTLCTYEISMQINTMIYCYYL